MTGTPAGSPGDRPEAAAGPVADPGSEPALGAESPDRRVEAWDDELEGWADDGGSSARAEVSSGGEPAEGHLPHHDAAERAGEPLIETRPRPAPRSAHMATDAELADWDEHTVASANGHVYQSLAWGEYRAAHGWDAWPIVFEDGFRMLVLGRNQRGGGGWAYATRGPLPEQDPTVSADRAGVAAQLVANEGMDSLTVDGETPAERGLGAALEARGFTPTEELQPSRHRMDVRFAPDDTPNSDDATIFASFGATTRNMIRQAERRGLKVLRLDAGGGRAEDGTGAGMLEDFELLDLDDAPTRERLLRGFYVMLEATAQRRGFALASEAAFLDWSTRGLRAGHLIYLQADHEEDGPVAGATFYRHGHRLTYSLAGDRAELRKKYPGAVRLLVWRGMQIALDERRTSMDLGGVDTEEARGLPRKGDPTYGMYQFKESFGARWVELTGAHKHTMRSRPIGSLAGKVLGRLAALRR